MSRNLQTAAAVVLSDADYARMRLVCPEDQPVSLSVWTAFLGKVFNKRISRSAALDIINAYNERRRAER